MVEAARLLDLGRRSYRDVWRLQHTIHAAVATGQAPPTWIFVEHDPVITLGRRTNRATALHLSDEELARRGIDCVAIERGGEATYHGPGQLVVYPILRLTRFREVVPLVRRLEAMVIELAARFAVRAERWSEHSGVWVGERQLCAIGLAIQRMTSLHGIALNVHTRLDYDTLIVPCGLPNRGITSLSEELGRRVTLAEARDVMREVAEEEFGIRFIAEESVGELEGTNAKRDES